jgi:hypothetical protein
MGVQSGISIARASVFAQAARRYWLRIFPCARVELNFWRRHAQQIPDRVLRLAALEALQTKSDVLEGAVAFAVFVPWPACMDVVQAITAFEIAFDYLDNVVELPNPDPILNSRSLCQALHAMVQPHLIHPDYYEHHLASDDGGYLEALVDRCRAALAKLPSYEVVAEPVCRALSRIIMYQPRGRQRLARYVQGMGTLAISAGDGTPMVGDGRRYGIAAGCARADRGGGRPGDRRGAGESDRVRLFPLVWSTEHAAR